ncbi:MAG: nitrogenase molybdenum-iron protein alpha chain [Treponema sp.]|jgi:nitrogenase molybdenum-iron protein alpha chain|nr:nitrogenase molybdenum-iron protein alpha chain [Treponema sp.]
MAAAYELSDIADYKAEVLEAYPPKIAKKRARQIVINRVENDDDVPEIMANTRTVPGIITMRGCAYAGCKGVVLGPTRDILQITHGPIGCGFYSWLTRRNQTRPYTDSDPNYITYAMSTDLQEDEIIFGGEKKLRAAIEEAVELFHPRAIGIFATCPVGLIGDDVHAVARAMEEKYPDINIFGFSCEGYKGVSQSAGHHIANNTLMRRVIGTGDAAPKTQYSLNLLGEYNIGGDGWETERLLKRIGYEVVSVMTGDGSFEDLRNAHLANLNLVQCHRSINYIAEMMKTKYGIDWLKVNFIGIDATITSLREIAAYFGNDGLIRRTEEVIADETAQIAEARNYYREKLNGKTAALYVGGSRAHHYQYLLADFGVTTVLAGHEFAHRDDYEGRKVIPTIKEDADNKNIESLVVEKDEAKYHSYLTPERYAELKDKIQLEDYQGIIPAMKTGTFVVDDLNHYETEEFLAQLKPDMFFSGIKDKYILQKAGVMSRQLHSYDYSGPYAGFQGAVNFARDITMGLYAPVWGLVTPPWKNKPMLEAAVKEEKIHA